MNRGYIKFWRKAQDSSSWNRGLMYQGLIINFLNRAAWKKGGYQGRDILPGQFGVVLRQLADSLDVPKTTFNRMLSHLEKDGFLTVENVGNRFSIITITNWRNYQEQDNGERDTNGTPVVRQRDARGTPSYKEEERKNKEEIYNTPLGEKHTIPREPDPTPDVGSDFFENSPSIEFQELRHYYDQHGRPEAPRTGLTEFCQIRTSRAAWPGKDAIYNAIDQHKLLSPSWAEFPPGLARFLRERWWEKTPNAARASPRTQQADQRENLAIFAIAANQELQNGFKESNRGENSRSGDDLPPEYESCGVSGAVSGIR